MKKVLIVFNHPAPYKVRLFNELSKNFELHVIFERSSASDRNKQFYFEEKCSFIEHKIKGIKLGRENIFSTGVVNHLKHNKYDLVIMNGYSQIAEIFAIRYLKKNNIPYVLYINGGIVRKNEFPLLKWYKTKLISGAKAYFSPDKESNKYLVHYGAEEKAILNYPYSTIYRNEITDNLISKKVLRKSLPNKFDKMFVSVGQLIKRKNYMSLIKEWKEYPQNYGLYIIGDGNQMEKLSNFIQENNMKNVILTGYLPRSETFNYMRMADVFLFPSNEDIYGHVINEALSQGTPVISTKHVNSAMKLIKDRVNGFLVDSLTGEELKNSINFCLEHDLTNRCIETAEENTIEVMAQDFKRIINKVM